MDLTTNAKLELVAQEAYMSFCDTYNPRMWTTWCSWSQLGDKTKGFWISQVKIIYEKVRLIDLGSEDNIFPELPNPPQ
jgi:hypothetical protein